MSSGDLYNFIFMKACKSWTPQSPLIKTFGHLVFLLRAKQGNCWMQITKIVNIKGHYIVQDS